MALVRFPWQMTASFKPAVEMQVLEDALDIASDHAMVLADMLNVAVTEGGVAKEAGLTDLDLLRNWIQDAGEYLLL